MKPTSSLKHAFALFLMSASLCLAAPTSGIVQADEHPSLQSAVDALGSRGGVIQLSAKDYRITEPIRLRNRVVFQGVMDSKGRSAVTKILPASDFEGQWLFETVAQPASTNPELNGDFGFYDLVVTGSPEIGGINAVNGDVIRIERSRFAYMRTCVNVTQLTNLPRPYPAPIVPGGLFLNASIFQATEVCLNLEYATQNRIIGNWFVSNSGVVLRLLNSNKTWFVANEVNQFTRAAILLEDDGGGGNYTHDIVISLNWMHSTRPDTRFVETVNGDKMRDILISENIMQGSAGVNLPPMDISTGNRFSGNTGAVSARTDTSGTATVPAGQKVVLVRHGLPKAPRHITVTPDAETSAYWIGKRTDDTFELHCKTPSSQAVSFSWNARLHP